MPAGPIGTCWSSGTWDDTAWEFGSWGAAVVVVFPGIDRIAVHQPYVFRTASVTGDVERVADVPTYIDREGVGA